MSECLGLQSQRNHNFQITHSSQTFLQVPVCNVIYAGLGSNLGGGGLLLRINTIIKLLYSESD